MNTDITALAQSMKAAAEKATQGEWYVDNDFDVCSADYGFVGEVSGNNVVYNVKYISEASPANVLALVEALEKAQSKASRLELRNIIISGERDRYEEQASGNLHELLKPYNVSPEESHQVAELLKVTRFPHRTVLIVFDHPTFGDRHFSPEMLQAHAELNAGGASENNFIASNGVRVRWINLA